MLVGLSAVALVEREGEGFHSGIVTNGSGTCQGEVTLGDGKTVYPHCNGHHFIIVDYVDVIVIAACSEKQGDACIKNVLFHCCLKLKLINITDLVPCYRCNSNFKHLWTNLGLRFSICQTFWLTFLG